MGVDSWIAVVLFLVFIAPGLLYDVLAEKRLVRSTESTLRETGRIALASLAFSGLSCVALSGIGAWQNDLLPDWRKLLENPDDYFAEHYARVLWTLTAEVAIALALAYVWHRVRLGQRDAPLKVTSPWSQVFKDDKPKGRDLETQVCVELTNGDRIVGKLAWFTPSLTTEDRELVLQPPIYVQRPGKEAALSDARWERVIITGAQIVRLDVAYVPWSGPARSEAPTATS